jgi:integrase
MNFTEELDKAGSDLHSRAPQFTLTIIKKVSRYIQENTDTSSGKPVISPEVVKRICAALIKNYEHDPLTILSWKCFNQLNWRLSLSCGFKSEYIETPEQTERLLLVNAYKTKMNHLDYIDILADHVLTLPLPPGDDVYTVEVHYACALVTAAAYWGKMTFSGFDEFILSLQWGQIYFNPSYLIRNVLDSDAIKQYHLPFPANLFLNRLLIHSIGKIGVKSACKLTIESPAFQFDCFTLKDFPSIYKQWSGNVLETHVKSHVKGIDPDELRTAVIASTVLSDGVFRGTGPVPTFVMSSLSDTVPNYSTGNDSLTSLIPGYTPIRQDYCIRPKNSTFIEFQDIKLYEAISKITTVREALEKKEDWKKRRHEAERDILKYIAKYKSFLKPSAYINLDYYGRLIISLMYAYDKMSSVNALVGLLGGVLSELSNMDKIVYDLSVSDCVSILQRLSGRHSNLNVVSSMQTFLTWVSLELDDAFIVPDLFLLVRIHKIDLNKKPTFKPIVTFEVLDRALDILLPASEIPIKNAAQHLAYTRRIATKLTFYTGLRLNECINFRLTDIFEVNGSMLYVREGKTINAKRYLFLALLLPPSFLAEFDQYVSYRKSLDTQDDHLFVNSLFKKLDEKSLTRAVRIAFLQAGMPDFHYHLLRSSFGSWNLIRWFYAFYGYMVPQDTPFLKNEFFSTEAIESFKLLFLGVSGHKEGQESFTYALQVGAHLMGHGYAGVALEYYIGVIPWIFYLISRHYEIKEISLSSKQAQDLLGISYPTLPPELKGSTKKTVSTQFLLEEQYKQINRKVPMLRKHNKPNQSSKKEE